MKRKVLAVLFATALTAGMLSGCGSTDSTSDKADQKEESLEEETTQGQTAVDEETAAKAVSEESLSKIAREKLHVGPYILLGHGEAEQGGADKSSILCDIVESLIGATFIQHGIDEARRVVHHLVDDTLAEVATEGPALDWKTSLTVKAHEMGLPDPHYQTSVAGPEYALEFTARAILGDGGEVIGVGTGSSKRKAQLAAAEMGWKALDSRKGEMGGKQNGKTHKSHHRSHRKSNGGTQDAAQGK